eukprot:3785237-Pyramimonas_sp.AAC.1
MFGKVFFKNNLTREERAREKRLGHMKHNLSDHDSCKYTTVKIIWPKNIVAMKDGQGKERKVAWYDEEGKWHTTATGKAAEKA